MVEIHHSTKKRFTFYENILSNELVDELHDYYYGRIEERSIPVYGKQFVDIFKVGKKNKLTMNPEFNMGFPINILNIGGISNITSTVSWENLGQINKIYAFDIGP